MEAAVRAVRGVAHTLLDAAKELVRVGDTGLGQDDRELVAAHPARDVHRPHGLAETFRDLGENAVAGQMPDAVVDRLEVVEVEEDERDAAAVPLGPEHLTAKRLMEVAL